MKQLVVTSDAHRRKQLFRHIAKSHPDALAYLDCGDTELSEHAIVPFVSVRGNTDYYDYPSQRILTFGWLVFLVIHSHQIMRFNRDAALVNQAKRHGADVVLFGHYHTFYDKVVDGVHLISPGALSFNRDLSPSCYALLSLRDKQVSVQRVNLK